MPSSTKNGWADILGSDEHDDEPGGASTRADPASSADASPPIAVSRDPVLAAMAELDGLSSIPSDALKAASATERAATPASDPSAWSAGSDDAATIEAAPPADAGPRLVLPAPGGAGRAPSPDPEGDQPTVLDGADPVFSADHLLAHLEDDDAAPTASPSWWRTYKEVVIAAAVGSLVLALAIAYSTSQTDDEALPGRTRVAPPMAPTPVPPPAPVQEEKVEAPVVAAKPMVTIVSKPSGGLVEINGTVYGKTPLIMTAPPNVSSLEVAIKRDGFRRWVSLVEANDSGHYSVSADLVPAR